MSEPLLSLTSVSKRFPTKDGDLSILHDVSFSIAPGEKVAIVGPSGSGKSTLLSLIGLLDVPSGGDIAIEGTSVKTLDEKVLAKLRNESIGFVFQSFELISPFTVRENVAAPLDIAGKSVSREAVATLLEEVGLTHRGDALPATLSGGERQRVAIARALANNPKLILADEPTGSLDRATGERVLELLLRAVSERSTSLLVITHDDRVASYMDRVFEIKDGTLYERN
jgi:putative ABC transport system ATP-binding protein